MLKSSLQLLPCALTLQRVYNSLLLPPAKLFSCLQFVMTFSPLQGYYYSLQARPYTPDLLFQPRVNMKQFGRVPETKKGNKSSISDQTFEERES